MDTEAVSIPRYDRRTIVFHWLTAALVAAQWLGAQTIDWFPAGPLRIDARSVHIVGGVLLGIILLARLAWRMTGGRRLRPADRSPLHALAKLTHWSLYALLIGMIGVGLFVVWCRGDSIFGLFKIPQYIQGDRTLAHQMEDLHGTIGWVIVAVAGFHAAAALFHHFVWHDGVLARMVPAIRAR